MATLITKSGGSIDINTIKSGYYGTQLYFHIDQSYNERNGEGEAAIILTASECKDIISALNEYIKHVEGFDFVYTSESILKLLSVPKIQEVFKDLGYDKDDGIDIDQDGDIEIKR